MDEAERHARLRAGAIRIREQARKLKARAEAMPPGAMHDMLALQAQMLTDGAGDLEAQALALATPLGTA